MKLLSLIVAAVFAAASVNAIAQDKKAAKKPTAAECKKDPKMEGCAKAKK